MYRVTTIYKYKLRYYCYKIIILLFCVIFVVNAINIFKTWWHNFCYGSLVNICRIQWIFCWVKWIFCWIESIFCWVESTFCWVILYVRKFWRSNVAFQISEKILEIQCLETSGRNFRNPFFLISERILEILLCSCIMLMLCSIEVNDVTICL